MQRYRTAVSRQNKRLIVDPKGGNFGQGTIRGYSACSVGEALGHEHWCDETFINQVQSSIDESGKQGIKSRFTHGSMSADGIEDSLGRTLSAESTDSQKAVGDLHISSMANPEKRRQVLTGAQDTPEDFGASIVFTRDRQAELEFSLEHGAEVDDDGYLDMSGFESPDIANTENYRHVRLKQLHRVDLVGDPAANPDGLFGEHDVTFREAEQLLEFALGIGDEPKLEVLPLNPENVKSFVRKAVVEHWDEIAAIKRFDVGQAEELAKRLRAAEKRITELELELLR